MTLTLGKLNKNQLTIIFIGELQGKMGLNNQEIPDWMTINNAYHFMKFAFGSYGWLWYFYGRFCAALISVWNYITCCARCR